VAAVAAGLLSRARSIVEKWEWLPVSFGSQPKA